MLPFICLVLGLTPALAIGPSPGPARDGSAAASKPGDVPETFAETHRQMSVRGTLLRYTARAGTIALKTEEGKPRATIFYVAYTRDGVAEPESRPIVFAFNGGPGSSSVWLHMGLLGPRRVDVPEPGGSVAPPFSSVASDSTPLDVADLVFIDPVSTGYSRAAPGQDAKQFHGVEEDVRSVGEFIRLYVTRFGRWNSPKFLIGESYGTTRAAALVEHLQSELGMNFNGVVLISAVLNFETVHQDPSNDLPYALFLPSYTAAAWYHRVLAPDLQADFLKTLDEARRFAEGDYTLALMQGSNLPAASRDAVARRLARLTGLGEEFVLRCNLRVGVARFRKELLRSVRRTVGRFDCRYTGTDLDAAGETPEYDPSYSAVQAPYTDIFNRYVRGELRYITDLPYEVLTRRVQPWDMSQARNRYLDVGARLRSAMTKNPGLRVLVANGTFDLATPFMASEYTVAHLGLNPEQAPRLAMHSYEGGHMMYTSAEPRHRLADDLVRLIKDAASGSR